MPIRDAISPIASSRTLWFVFALALLAGAYSLVALWKDAAYYEVAKIPSNVHVVLTVVLGCLLVFRTNTAYNRWWEARTLWGALVNASRNLSLKICHLGDIGPNEREIARRAIMAYPVALCCHLRDECDTKLSSEIRELAHGFQHVPDGLVQQIYAVLGRAKAAGDIDGHEMRAMDLELLRYLDICGGCERIKGTRIVRSYRVFARQCVLLYLATLPWGIAHDFGWWTVPLTIIMAYFMLGLEIVAEHVEEPFGYDEDDLDLPQLCDTIARTVNEVFDKAKSAAEPAAVEVKS